MLIGVGIWSWRRSAPCWCGHDLGHREAAPMTGTDCTAARDAAAHLHAVMLLRCADGSIGRFRA
jgi:hypothetical protein